MIVGAEHQLMNNMVQPTHSHGPSIGARLSRGCISTGLVRWNRDPVGSWISVGKKTDVYASFYTRLPSPDIRV